MRSCARPCGCIKGPTPGTSKHEMSHTRRNLASYFDDPVADHSWYAQSQAELPTLDKWVTYNDPVKNKPYKVRLPNDENKSPNEIKQEHPSVTFHRRRRLWKETDYGVDHDKLRVQNQKIAENKAKLARWRAENPNTPAPENYTTHVPGTRWRRSDTGYKKDK